MSDSIQVLKGTKHPHAAMLFVDFISSMEAQRMVQVAEYFPSNPNVDPAPSLKMILPGALAAHAEKKLESRR